MELALGTAAALQPTLEIAKLIGPVKLAQLALGGVRLGYRGLKTASKLALRGGRALHRVTKSFGKKRSRKQFDMAHYKARRGTNKRRRPMPKTVRQTKRFNRVKRSRTRANKRYYKKRSRYRSKLRGLTGTQCIPKTAACALKRKIHGNGVSLTLGTSKWFSALLLTSDMQAGTFGLGTSVGVLIPDNTFTTPYIVNCLKDMFDEVRCSGIKISLVIQRYDLLNVDGTANDPAFVLVTPYRVDYGLTAVKNDLSITAEAYQDSKGIIRRYPANVAKLENAFVSASDHQHFVPTPFRRKFKKYYNVPTVMGYKHKEYFEDPDYANIITGGIGARTIATPVKDHMNLAFLLARDQNAANWTSNDVQKFQITGTITFYTHWRNSNQELRYEDG